MGEYFEHSAAEPASEDYQLVLYEWIFHPAFCRSKKVIQVRRGRHVDAGVHDRLISTSRVISGDRTRNTPFELRCTRVGSI